MYTDPENAKQENCGEDPVIRDLVLGLECLLKRPDRAAVIMVRLYQELIATKLIVGGHLCNAQGRLLQHTFAVMVVELGEKGKMAGKAIGAIRGHEATDKVAEGDLIVGDLGVGFDGRTRSTPLLAGSRDELVAVLAAVCCVAAPARCWGLCLTDIALELDLA
jgi:hypothetical protein